MKKINILYIIWSLRLGGAERVVTELAKHSNREIFIPMICCLNDKGIFSKEVEKKGIQVIPLYKKPKFDPIIVLKIIKLIRKYNIQVVNTHLWTANFWGRIAAFLAGVNVIVATEHTTDENRPWYYHIADQLLAHLTTRIIAVSTSVKDFHQQRSKITSNKFVVINNGIDTKAFDITIDTDEKRREFGLHSDDFVIGLFGRFVPAKAHEILLEALKKVIVKHPRVKVLFAGSGPTENKIKELTHELNLDNKVIFAGFRKDTPELYKIIDLFILCSTREGFPITLLEAITSGVPAIVTDVGGNADIIRNNENGILIEPNNSSLLANKINDMIEHPVHAQRMVCEALKDVQSKFTSSVMTAKTENLIKRLCLAYQTKARKIKLLLIIDHLDSGGAQRQIIELAKRLPRCNYHIVVCNLDGTRTTLQPEIEEVDIPVFSIDQHGFFDLKALLNLYSFIRANQFDIVHTYLFTADTYGRIAAILSSTPVIITSLRSVDTWKTRLHKTVDRILSPFTDKIIDNSKVITRYLIRDEHISRSKITTIYNGIDLQNLTISRSKSEIRSRLGISQDAILVGIFARNDPVKDHKTFFRAAKIVYDSHQNCNFIAMGDGMIQEPMRNLVDILHISNCVFLKDHTSMYLDYINCTDIVVLSSLVEGCSNSILEAMAFGKPVVATEVGGNPELIIDRKTGLLVPPQNPEKLAEAIIYLINDTKKRISFGKAGKERVIKYFTMDKMIKNTMDLYERVLSEKLNMNIWKSIS